ncbi:response regulator [Flavobacterium sp. W22_SRS_FP1]|uniref:response regulator n=1 Tax=Flavobacterium sp. W22_SRS_FP1 TaxID=3240276 RepID=UPI003F8FA97E
MKKNKIAFIIDDDPIHVFLTKRYMEKTSELGSIMVFKNGKEAYDYLHAISSDEDKVPEIILLDINMPIWDGWHFLDEFKKLKFKQKIKVYLLTSSISKEDYKKAAQYGLDDKYILKPLTSDKVKEIMNVIH